MHACSCPVVPSSPDRHELIGRKFLNILCKATSHLALRGGGDVGFNHGQVAEVILGVGGRDLHDLLLAGRSHSDIVLN